MTFSLTPAHLLKSSSRVVTTQKNKKRLKKLFDARRREAQNDECTPAYTSTHDGIASAHFPENLARGQQQQRGQATKRLDGPRTRAEILRAYRRFGTHGSITPAYFLGTKLVVTKNKNTGSTNNRSERKEKQAENNTPTAVPVCEGAATAGQTTPLRDRRKAPASLTPRIA